MNIQAVYSSPVVPGTGGPGTIAYHGGLAFDRLYQDHGIEGRLYKPTEEAEKWGWLKDHMVDVEVALHIPGTVELFHGFNNASLFTMREIPEATTFIERASTYVLHQERVVQAENDFLGIKQEAINPGNRRKMVKELDLCTNIMTPSQQAYESFPDPLKEKVHILEFGADLDRYPRPPSHPEAFHVLYLGGPWVRKGLMYLLKAWTLMTENGTNKGTLDINIGSMQFPGVDYSNIRTHGWADDLDALWKWATVFCLPSLEEGQAIACWDAMANGLPVVVTRETGAPIEDGKEGLFVKSRDPEALQDSLQHLHDNPSEVKRMGRNARKKAESRTWKDYEEELVEIWRSWG